jgi:hypothetical protein
MSIYSYTLLDVLFKVSKMRKLFKNIAKIGGFVSFCELFFRNRVLLLKEITETD